MVSKFWPKLVNGTTFHQLDHFQQPSISIQLLESVLYTHTGNNPILRGVVEINVKKPVLVSSLRLDFKGHLAYCLTKPDLSCQKEFAQCSLPLYPASTLVNTLSSSSSSSSKPLVIGGENSKPTRFAFEMPLLNNNDSKYHPSLIQSIQSKEFKVKYKVDAILGYQPYSPSQQPPIHDPRRSSVLFLRSSPQPITIVQLPTYDDGCTFLTNDSMLSSIDSRKQANQWCQYHVKVDKKCAAMSSLLSLSVKMAPLIQGLKLTQASMQIVQHYTITDPSVPQQTYSRSPIPLDCHYQSTPYPSSSSSSFTTGGSLYEGEFQFKIPSHTKGATPKIINPTGLVPSMQTNPVSNIKVSHHLLVNLTLSYPKLAQDGIVRQARRLLTFQCDFDLLHPCMADSMSDKILRLPAYETPSTELKPQQSQQQQKQQKQPKYTRIAKELFQGCPLPSLPSPSSSSSSSPSSLPPLYDHAILLPPAVV